MKNLTKRLYKRNSIFIALILSISFGNAQTTLSPGDIALIGFNFDTPDEIGFVALVDFEAGTEIYFTDNGWLATNAFRGGEGTHTYTAVSAVTAGEVVSFATSGPALSGSGDQVIAYQGTAESPTLIYALNSEGLGWQADATSSNTSALPLGLTDGVSAIALAEVDNGYYSGTTSGTKAELLTAISNTTNWITNNSYIDKSNWTTSFTISSAGSDTDPPIATITPTGATELISVNPTITFNQAVVNTDASEITDANVDALVELKETDVNGTSVTFDATINAGKTEITITPSSDLDYSTTYYVALKTAVEDAAGNEIAVGDLPISETFTTQAAPAPSITITAPNGSESWEQGATENITWSSENYSGTVDIEYTTNGSSFTTIATGETNDGAYAWDIAVDQPVASSYQIRISDDLSSQAVSDLSDAEFEIKAPLVAAKLIISQYYEGSSNNKWIEITNVDDHTVDLTEYYVCRWSNTDSPSGTPSNNENLSGSLAAGTSVLIQHASSVLPDYCTGTNSTACYFNGDDPVALTFTSTNWSDRIDCIYASGTWGGNTSFYRNANVLTGNTDISVLDGSGEWTEVSNATVDDDAGTTGQTERLGYHEYGLSDDATLKDLTIDAVTVDGFDAATLAYTHELPYGSFVVPTVAATTTYANATAVVTQAQNLNGTQAERTSSILVTAEDGTTTQTYTIEFSVAAPSTITTLSDLTVNGTTVDGFDSSTETYNVVLAHGTTVVPTVAGTPTDTNASSNVVNATDLNGTEAERTSTLTVTAEDVSTTRDYKVIFRLETDDATLSDLTINGTTVDGFNTLTETYNVVLTYGTTLVPTVVGIGNDANASVAVVDATNLEGTEAERTSKVTVTAENGSTTKAYNIIFRLESDDASASDLTIDGNQVTGFVSSTLIYTQELPYGTTDVPIVNVIPTEANASGNVTQAQNLDGTQTERTATAVVTAENGTTTETYTIEFSVAAAGEDATLSDLTVDGTTIDGFTSSSETYNFLLDPGTTIIPIVAATATDANATIGIVDATDLNGTEAERTTTVTVESESGSENKTYIIVFRIKSQDATASSLTIDGTAVTGFDAETLIYTKVLAYGTTLVPTISSTANDANASLILTQAQNLDGTQAERTATAEITAEDGTTINAYTIEFSVAEASTDATLTDLTVNGTTIAVFDASTLEYTEVLAYGTTNVPTVVATLNDATASVNQVNATSVTGSQSERTTTIIVTAQDGTTENVYSIVFRVESGDATLSNLTVNGTTIDGFDAARLSYVELLPYGTTVVPTVVGTANDANANISLTNATDLSGASAERTATISVTAENGSTTVDYTVVFRVKSNIATLSDLLSDGTTVENFASATYSYFVDLPYGTSAVPVVTATTSDANAALSIVDATDLNGTAAERTTTVLVTAEDDNYSQAYSIIYAVLLNNDASVSSAIYNVDMAANTITNIPFGTTLAEFEANITAADGAVVEIYMADGTTIASDLQSGYILYVVAQNGSDDESYTITLNAEIPVDLFFSEYIEGSGDNKAVEIYNPTGADVDLSVYTVKLATNGNNWANNMALSGTLPAGDVYVIYNSNSAAEIQAEGDVTSNITFFNGDDAVGLFKNDVLIDAMGTQGEDPGSAWDVAGVTGATSNHTLVRKFAVDRGNTNWSLSAGTTEENSEWLVFDQNEFSYIGSHEEIVPSSETDFLSFAVPGQLGETLIDEVNHLVTFQMETGTNVTALKPAFTISEGAQVTPTTGSILDFTNAVTYTITAEDEVTEQDWIASVSFIDQNQDDATLSNLLINGSTISGFDAATLAYNVELPIGTTLVPAVTATPNNFNATIVINETTLLPGSTTVTVTSGDDSNTQIYTINFTVAANNDASLADIQVNGSSISGFDANTFSYNIELEYGTTTIPTTTVTTSDVNASAEITDATNLPGSTTILVTAADGTTMLTYTLNFTIADNNDATLAHISVDGTSIESFDAATYSYTVELDYGTTIVPTVLATTTDPNANAVITDATSLPGASTISVTAEDGTTELTYTINFTLAANSDATLASLSVNGTSVANFDANTLVYEHTIAANVTVVPAVTAMANDVNANVSINEATEIPGTTTIEVIAEDGSTELTYEVRFTHGNLSDEASLSNLTVDDETVAGFNSDSLNYTIVLPYGSTVIPLINGVATDINATVEVNQALQIPGVATIVVTAEDQETELTYLVIFTVTPPATDATLSSITIDGNALAEFSSDVLSYSIELASSTTTVPTVVAIANDANATIMKSNATSIPGITEIVVTAQDGETRQTYQIGFTHENLNNDAMLSDLTVGGSTIDGFNADSLFYNVEMPYGTDTYPTIFAVTNNSNASLSINIPISFPGTVSVNVTAEDLVTTNTYSIEFTVGKNTDASLTQIIVNDVELANFDSTKLFYVIELPVGTTNIPNVSATAFDINATVNITDATSIPGTTEIEVTAADGETSLVYELSFTTVDLSNNAYLSNLTVDQATISAFDSTQIYYAMELAYGTTVIPVVDGHSSDVNATLNVVQAQELPGKASIEVIAENQVTKMVYSIAFTVAEPSTDASLSELTVNGTALSIFSPSTLVYNVELPVGTIELPIIGGTTTSADAEKQLTQVADLPGKASIQITAQDSTTQLVYEVNFTVAVGVVKITSNSINVYPNPTSGKVFISIDWMDENTSLFVISSEGKIIKTQALQELNSQIDLSNHDSGIYFVKVVNATQTKIIKVVYNK